MSNYEQKPNSFSLFKNEKKEKENQPDYSGTMTDENGKVFRISAWVNTAKSSGTKYLGGLISEMAPVQTKPVTEPNTSDDLPF